MFRQPLRFICAGTVCGLLLVCVGCGTGEYEARYQAELKAEQAESPYTVLYAPLQVPGSPFKIRIPKVFRDCYIHNSPHEDDNKGKLIDERRLMSPLVRLPGFQMCFEGKTGRKNNGEEYAYYCYLAAGPIGSTEQDKKQWDLTLGKLQSDLKSKLPDTTAWTKVACPGPGEKTVEWQMLTAQGEQQFFIKQSGDRKDDKYPGTFELYYYQAENYFLLVGWRLPEMAYKDVKLSDLARLTAGTVEVGPLPSKKEEKPKEEKSPVGQGKAAKK